jgi:phage tail sheath protein FI
MPFQVSPGINVSEIDLTAVVPAVSTTTAGIAGHYRWGSVNKATLISSEDALVGQFGKPNSDTATDFFTAANFLAYGNALFVVRAENSTMSNAHANAANTTVTRFDNDDDYENNHSSGTTGVGRWVAKYPGALGNSLKVSICSSSDAFSSTLSGTFSVTSNTTTVTFSANQSGNIVVGDYLELGSPSGVKQSRRVSAIAANGTSATLENRYTGDTLSANTSLTRKWEYSVNTDRAPGTSATATKAGATTDELHIAVVDEDGLWTGTKGQVLEVFQNISMATDGKTDTGQNNYFVDVINNRSRYLWWAASTSVGTNVGTSVVGGTTYTGSTIPLTDSLVNGSDGAAPTNANVIIAYDKFKSAEDVDLSFILGSGNGQTVATHLIDNIASVRKDLLVVLSPTRGAVVNNNTYEGKEQEDIIAYRNSLPSTSYATMDSAWKYQYDKYNDLYRYVPANGDTAGLMVRTDNTNDPWYSPAGFNRGSMKNVVKLAYNPRKADRDELYKNGINPVVTFPGQGTVLYGDKTLLANPSAFDRINVRRLFIVLEKAISLASQTTLFEFNDAFTRAQFRNLVEPFLRDVQGRRGITDFRVVCDETNNTGEVIDRNEFIGDIYIKPARSINFIQLNFVAVRTGVEFSEIVGQV